MFDKKNMQKKTNKLSINPLTMYASHEKQKK